MRVLSEAAPVMAQVDLICSEDELRTSAFQIAEEAARQVVRYRANYAAPRTLTVEWNIRLRARGQYLVRAVLLLPHATQPLTDPERIRARYDDLAAAEVPDMAADVVKILKGALGP